MNGKSDLDNYVLVTDRDYTVIFNPFNYSEFKHLITNQNSGNFIVGFTPDFGENAGKNIDTYIYFRWMPHYSPENEQFLVVGAVSKYSIQTQIASWVFTGLWVCLIVYAIYCMWLAFGIFQFRYEIMKSETEVILEEGFDT